VTDPGSNGAGGASEATFRVVIAGGGVSGLTTALRLVQAGRTKDGRRIQVTLLENRDRLGGNIRTEKVGDYVIDGGPDAWVTAKPHASALAKELGLGDRLLGTTVANRRVLVLDRGRLHPFPEGMLLTIPTQVWPFLKTRLLSPFGKIRAGFDFLLPRRTDPSDESIASFVRRRFGSEVLRKIGGPLLGGVFAGDVEQLSIRSTFPQLVDLETRHRSLILGARADMKKRAAARKEGGGGPAPSVFHSFPGGLGELAAALVKRVEDSGAKVAMKTRVTRVERGADGARFRVHAEGPDGPLSLDADAVVMATPGYVSAEALKELDREMSETLRDVPYGSSVVLGIAYPRANIAHPLNATGIITTDKPGVPIAAVTFLSSKWAGRAPEDGALFRVFMGGAGHADTLSMSDATLTAIAEKELATLVGARGTPTFVKVYRHERASAQPVLGHDMRVKRVRAREQQVPGLYVVGASMDGVGIPDCVRQANDLAKRVVEAG
jgi:oxygen-dependent protoporphyrinogen oxidase